jgi:cell division transport system permease protein
MKALAVRAHGLRETWRLLRRRPASFVLAVLMAGVAFTALLIGASLLRAAAPLAERLPRGPEINLFLSASAAPTEVRELQSRLAGRPDVAQVEFIGREAALQSLAGRAGNRGLGELKPNPLPDVLVVTLAAEAAPAAVEQAMAEMRRLPRVESVLADTSWHQNLVALRKAVARLGAVSAALAAALLALIVIASVRLQLAGSAEDVQVLRQVGADTRFIVRPFVYAGALALSAGVLLAGAAAAFALTALAAPLAALAQVYGVDLAPEPLPWPWLLALAAAAALLGGMIAALGARWVLRSAD